MARAGRQATTVTVRSRPHRRSGPRTFHQELFGRLTFERRIELEIIACRLAVQEQVISELQPRDKRPVHHPTT
jgi:hypothetical protein